MDNTIKNKVAESGIISIDLESFLPTEEIVVFDIKTLLFQELILKEKEFRAFIKENDWTIYKDKFVTLTCSNDAIVPTWAYMLLAIALEPFAKKIHHGTKEEFQKIILIEAIQKINVNEFENARVVIKGCGNNVIPESAFVLISALLKPHVKSLMFGEPCSTVPLYKVAK
ncbi:MAG: DUF2480 family protein [Sphingobacteriaceae bacterium]|nr:DUF2480 family protein [Sphingobacteriaceae bacterium]